MNENPKSYEVIILDHYEVLTDEFGAYLALYNVDGNMFKIGNKRQDKWQIKTALGQLVILTFETFSPKDKPNEKIKYISDAKTVEASEFEFAQSVIRGTLKRLLTASDEDRQRSQSLAYAKDLEVARIASGDSKYAVVDTDAILSVAKTFFAFIKGVDTIKDNHNAEIGVEDNG
jgi:hypothetical protein